MLNTPRKTTPPSISIIPSKVPTADEVVVLSQPLVKATAKLAQMLTNNVRAKWAVGGDAGELMMGVNVKADRLEILTTKQGCEEICEKMAGYQTLAPGVAERKLAWEADIDGVMMPIWIKSYYAELTIDGVKVEVHGDEQIKVGEWDWGDPLDFEPDFTYISGGQLPLVPLSLKTELALGLGWLDRVTLISDAILQKHHDH